jgi:hypothetical protein
MTEEGTLAVNADVKEESGANANATYTAEAYTNKYIKKAEGKLCLDTRYDWVTNYASVSTIGKEVLRQAVSCLAAIKCINADMSGFTSRQEALIMINVLWAQYSEIVAKIVSDNKYKEWILEGGGDID